MAEVQTAPDAGSWSARGYIIAGFVALVVLVGGFGGWGVLTNIAGAIIAPGAIEIEQNRQVVQHLDGGVVRSIEVREGDFVAPGDVLIRLDPEQIQSELTIVENQLFEILARRGRLEAERIDADSISFPTALTEAAEQAGGAQDVMLAQERLFEQRRETLAAEKEQLEKRLGQITSQNQGIAAQQEALTKQLDLISEELANKRSLLEKGLAQSSVVLALERDRAALLGEQGELVALVAQNEGRMTEIEIEILKLGQARREEATEVLSDLGYQEAELSERRRALRVQLGRLDIRAPLGGVVHAMQVFTDREVIRPAQPLLYIVPQDQPLVIGVRVEPIHVDEIHIGQEVLVRMAALDSRITPELSGRVTNVSPDVLTDENTGATFFRALIELDEEALAELPEDTVLVPGMPVEAYLRTSDRSPMAYLVKPLSDFFSRAFRES